MLENAGVRAVGLFAEVVETMSDVPGTTALASLIDEVKRRNDWSDTAIADRATERGYKLTKSDISLYRKSGMKTVVPSKLLALGEGLRMPAYRVAEAVLTDLGVDFPNGAPTPEATIERDHTLTAQLRDNLLLLIAAERS